MRPYLSPFFSQTTIQQANDSDEEPRILEWRNPNIPFNYKVFINSIYLKCEAIQHACAYFCNALHVVKGSADVLENN